MYAFAVEYKVRELVSKILCHILYREPDVENYRLEEERIMNIIDHGKQFIKPDFEIMLKDEDVSQLIVEVKAMPKKNVEVKKLSPANLKIDVEEGNVKRVEENLAPQHIK